MQRDDWMLREGVIYLNHGSFGPSAKSVVEVRERWSRELEAEPMDFLTRRMETHLWEALDRLAGFVGTESRHLTLVENATFGMNAVARTVPLSRGDEVLLTDHEYGAVMRIWRQRCKEVGAKLVVQALPEPLDSTEELVTQFLSGLSERTKLIVVSHVTSQTSAIFPVKEICREARRLKIPVAIDGPHAIAMIDVRLNDIDCDFYCASGHKWLCGPFGTGFLYVAPRWQHRIVPAIVSWGGSVSGRATCWQDEFLWSGTRDPSGFLALPEAIRVLEEAGVDRYRAHGHRLVNLARDELSRITGLAPLLPPSSDWYGTMLTLPLPGTPGQGGQHGVRDPLQSMLWEQFRIEVPVFQWKGNRFLRVSAHLYNSEEDIRALVDAVQGLPREIRGF